MYIYSEVIVTFPYDHCRFSKGIKRRARCRIETAKPKLRIYAHIAILRNSKNFCIWYSDPLQITIFPCPVLAFTLEDMDQDTYPR